MDRGDPKDPLSNAFEPNRMKVADLRSLLFSHDISVPSNARKAALIQAYEENIRPFIDELRAARNSELNIRPDGREIVYLPNGQAQRSSSVSANEGLQVKASPANKSRMRRSVSWADSNQSGEEDSSINAVGPADTSADVSAFSLDNPFQTTKATPSSKKSSTPRKARASEPAKKDGALQAMRKRPSGSRHSMPVSRRSKTSSEDDNEVDDSNLDVDNTRSSAVSPLVQKQRRIRQWVDHAKTDLLGAGAGKDEDGEENESEEGSFVGFLSLLVAIAVLAWWTWYARESRTLGFCDTGRSSNAILQQRAMNLASARLHASKEETLSVKSVLLRARLSDHLRPSCAACPAHARCSQGQLTGCESDEYVLQEPMLAHIPLLRSFFPLSSTAPACAPDEEKLLLAADLADEIENRLRRFKADVYCNRKRARLGPRDEPDWGPDGVYAMPLSDVYHDLRTAASKSNALRTHGDDFFRQLWDLAMSDLEASGRAQQRSSRILAMRGPVGVGVQCRAGLAAASVWRRSRVWLVAVLTGTLIVRWLFARIRGTSRARKQAQALTQVCLARLQVVKRRSVHASELRSSLGGGSSPSTTPGGGIDPFLSITQLRDNLLRDQHDAVKRKALWARVSRLTESNTNVRTRQAKVQGEWSRVWEWVGPVDEEDSDVGGQEMSQRGTPTTTRKSIDGRANVSASQDVNGRFGADDVPPERPLMGNEYNAGHGRRPSAEI